MKNLKKIFAAISMAVLLTSGLGPAEAAAPCSAESHEAACEARLLPACFSYMDDGQKAKQYEAIARMSDEEWAAYLAIAAKEPAITADVQKVARQNGAALAGLEYRLKSPASTYEKIHSRDEHLDMSTIRDIIRYTMIYSPEALAAGTNAALKELEALGYTITRVHNTWDVKDTPYRGINTNLKTADGQIIEIQFHTQESFDFKNGEDHRIYEARRALAPDDPSARLLTQESIRKAAALKRPAHVETVEER